MPVWTAPKLARKVRSERPPRGFAIAAWALADAERASSPSVIAKTPRDTSTASSPRALTRFGSVSA
jgi:hypothetical protein